MGRPPLADKKLRQLSIALPPEVRLKLEASAAERGVGLAEEIRHRLERTFLVDSVDNPTRELVYTFDNLISMVRIQTGFNWFNHPDAWAALRAAIIARLDRLRPAEPRTAEPDTPPHPVIQSDDPQAIGTAIEAIAFMDSLRSDPELVEHAHAISRLRAADKKERS
jgi:hypothetical protein